MSILYASTILADKLSHGKYPGFSSENLRLFDPALSFVRNPDGAVQALIDLLLQDPPCVAAIGTTSYAYFWALKMAHAVKESQPDCPIIFGGPHEDEGGSVSIGGSILEYGELVDFAVQGDGEHLFDKLFELLCETRFSVEEVKARLVYDSTVLSGIKGSGAVIFNWHGQVRTVAAGGTFRAGLMGRGRNPLDLNELPSPPRWLLSAEHKYLFDVFRHRDSGVLKATAQLMTTRGCKFACSFCTERGAVSYRNVPSVIDELRKVRDLGYEAVFFDDSTFHLYEDIHALLDELTACRRELNLEFGCLTRVDCIVDEEKSLPLSRFEEAGFTYFYLGIEHDDDAVLNEMRKGYNQEKLHYCLTMIGRSSLRLGVSLLFGFGSETEESRRRSLELVASHPNIILANLSILAYHPAAVISRRDKDRLRYDVPSPNVEPEWDLFEEGRWYHPKHVTLEYARGIHRLVNQVDENSGGRLISKLKRARNVLPVSGMAPSPIPDEINTKSW